MAKKRTASCGTSARELAEQAIEGSPSGAHKRCTGGLLESTATKGEQTEEWYVSPCAADHDADSGKDSGGAQPQIVRRPVLVLQVMVQEAVREAD